MRLPRAALALLLAAAPALAARVEVAPDVVAPEVGHVVSLTGAAAAPTAVLSAPALSALAAPSASPVAAVPPSAAPLAAPAAAPAKLAPALPAPAALPAAAASPEARGPPAAQAAPAPVAAHAALEYADPYARDREAVDRRLDALFDGGWSLKRTPVGRGEIGWKRAAQLLNPGGDDNTVKAAFKFDRERALESKMWGHNVRYVLGLTPRTYQDQANRDRRLDRLAKLVERGTRVRAAYGLRPFELGRLPVVEPAEKLGEGGQGKAFAVKGAPDRALKVFDRAAGPQVQEIAAIMNALADQGAAVARVRVVRLPDGRPALEMPRYDRATGWRLLSDQVRWHPKDPKSRAGEAVAMATLRSVGKETERVLGVDAADWKAGFDGGDGDEFLENFAIEEKTGAVVAFDPLAVW